MNRFPVRLLLVALAASLLQGCALPRVLAVHDGLRTTVIDAETRAPIADAVVFTHRDTTGRPIVLGRSDQTGHVDFEPRSKLGWVPLLGEGMIFFLLSVCRDGYMPAEIQTRGGWNADFRPARVHEQAWVELQRAGIDAPGQCPAGD